MQMIKMKDLKEHPRNNEFFDDMEGSKWEDFKKSVERRGVVEAIVITQELIIVSGHQRVRACKELGIESVPCRVAPYIKDEERNISVEDMIIEDLICTNIMQRGVGNVNPMKMAKCIMELERIYGVKQGRGGNTNRDNLHCSITQKDLAENVGISQRQLSDYKKLQKLIPELQDLIEDGEMKATVGYKVWAKMSVEEQEKFFNEIGADKIKTLTYKATEELVNEKLELQRQLKEAKNKKPEVIEVDNTDYTAVKRADRLEEDVRKKEEQINNLKRKLELTQDLAKAYEQDSEEYKKMKEDIEHLTSKKDSLGRQIQAVTDISGLVVEIDHILKTKLAPVKYSKSIKEASSDKIVIDNLREIIEVVDSWSYEMKQLLPEEIDYVEVL